MRFSSFAVLASVATSLASPLFKHVVHEKRNHLPPGWTESQKLPSNVELPVRIALKQSNLDHVHEYLLEVSDPTSHRFAQHWNAKHVAETFAPSQDAVDLVTQWLTASGIPIEQIRRSQSLGWLQLNISVAQAEQLLKTQFHIYTHISGQPHIACNEYSVPEHVREHIDFITPTVQFDTKIRAPIKGQSPRFKKRDDIQRREASSTLAAVGHPIQTGVAQKIGSPSSGSLPKPGKILGLHGILNELKDCNVQITPDCLRALYEFPPGVSANSKNSYGIVEYTPQSYLPADLDLFFANFSKRSVGSRPIFDSIDGGVLQTTNESFSFNGESDLDLEYAMTLVYPQNVTLYQVGDLVEGASFNNFLDAIDGSYCTFEGGDDPTQDGIYPDALPGGYEGPENCGGFAATNVISTSYSYNEADLTPFYEQRQCAEYAKLGLQGKTIVYSSGDFGVAGNLDECIDPTTHSYNDGTSGIFNPSFPGTCPYVTSVGATQVATGASVTQPEIACETVIFSGGGFSNVFPLPDYQRAAVRNWFAQHPPPYGADRFNNSQSTRGYPDVSANGANYVVAIDGTFALVYGTSASSPTFGSIITLINEARIGVGKGPVGFLNPTLYAHPNVLNDITSGNNPGCGTDGFSAAKGWDPVTGLGTPNFPRMLALFLGLP